VGKGRLPCLGAVPCTKNCNNVAVLLVRPQAVAQAATSTGARGLMSQWQRQAALAAAQKGLTSATMRYSAVQSALSFLGPVMWAWLAVDLVRAAVGTDYARVVRAVYILAQVHRDVWTAVAGWVLRS
jgi:uncharacterized protein YaaW (UPF0174 family)